MRVAMLTGGGDCPGLNAVMRAAVRKGERHFDDDFIGFVDGWRGVIEGKTVSQESLPVRAGERITDRPANNVVDQEHDDSCRQTGYETTRQSVGQVREIEPADVIANVRCHAADDQGRKIERPGSQAPQGQNRSRMG